MSWQAVTWVLEFSEAEGYSRLVLISIASHSNREGLNAFPTLDSIALEARVSRREVIYCVQELEEAGELRVFRGIGRGRPNHYELPRVAEWLTSPKNKYIKKVQDVHPLEAGKGASKSVKGANRYQKGANSTQKQVSSLLESSKCKTERLEQSKAITVKQVLKSLSFPEPPKSQDEMRAAIEQQKQVLREKGFLQ